MFAFSAIASLALFLTGASATAIRLESRSSACDGLGPNAVDNITTRNFILGADGGTIPNPEELVLADPTSGAPFKVLGTFNTHPSAPFVTSFDLENGALTPLFSFAGAVPQPVTPGSLVTFVESSSATPAEIYCTVPQNDEDNITLLAVNGDVDSFALCAEKQETPAFSVFSLVYKPDPSSSEYDFSTCRSAKVRVI